MSSKYFCGIFGKPNTKSLKKKKSNLKDGVDYTSNTSLSCQSSNNNSTYYLANTNSDSQKSDLGSDSSQTRFSLEDGEKIQSEESEGSGNIF